MQCRLEDPLDKRPNFFHFSIMPRALCWRCLFARSWDAILHSSWGMGGVRERKGDDNRGLPRRLAVTVFFLPPSCNFIGSTQDSLKFDLIIKYGIRSQNNLVKKSYFRWCWKACDGAFLPQARDGKSNLPTRTIRSHIRETKRRNRVEPGLMPHPNLIYF